MVALSIESIAQDARLVTCLRDQIVATIMRPAAEALSQISVDRIRPVVARHVAAGRLDVARSLVSDEVMVGCLSREISRHLAGGECGQCPDGWRYCSVLEQMEAREEKLHDLIQQAGGW